MAKYLHKSPEEIEKIRKRARDLARERRKDPAIRRAAADTAARWRARNPEYMAAYSKRTPEKNRIRSKRYRASAKGAKYNKEYRQKNHRRDTLRKYGITPEEYDRLLQAQDGACAICRTTTPADRKLMNVDHDHATGIVRGLLCGPCNRGIGLLQDDPMVLDAAARYLRRGY